MQNQPRLGHRQASTLNLDLAQSPEQVDRMNAEFYRRFPYPWPAALLLSFRDPSFGPLLLNQDLGDYQHRRIAPRPDIWVAGCGTNQAAMTALRFPSSQVVGSDLSEESLASCRRTADQTGVKNLDLRRESLNDVEYRECFDYVICTGVIHHNYEPRQPLEKLAAALRPGGVMELMVYNEYHWMRPACFQRAVRLLQGTTDAPDFEEELTTAHRIAKEISDESSMGSFLKPHRDSHESQFADALLQPVLHTATVESLAELAGTCGLELLLPCLSSFDVNQKSIGLSLVFEDPELRSRAASLSDFDRWKLSNLLLQEQVPYLWFYLQRQDAGQPRESELQICERFLDTVFKPLAVRADAWVRNEGGKYQALPNRPFPPPPPSRLRPLLKALDGRRTIAQALTSLTSDERSRLAIDTRPGEKLDARREFLVINDLRMRLTTGAFPFLGAQET